MAAEVEMEKMIAEYLEKKGKFSKREKNTYMKIWAYLTDDNFDDNNPNHVEFRDIYVYEDDMEEKINDYLYRRIVLKEPSDESLENEIDEYLDFCFDPKNPNHETYTSIA